MVLLHEAVGVLYLANYDLVFTSCVDLIDGRLVRATYTHRDLLGNAVDLHSLLISHRHHTIVRLQVNSAAFHVGLLWVKASLQTHFTSATNLSSGWPAR